MADEDKKAPNLAEEIKNWVYRRLGIPGLVGLMLAGALLYVLTNWDKVSKWPVVGTVARYCTRAGVPKADPQRFGILVAHLENDDKGEHERLIVEALREFEGVQVLSLDRSLELAGPVPEETERRGREEAQKYLQQSGAAVLIWGTVLSRGGEAVYKLYWTPAAGEGRRPGRYEAPRALEQFRLPEVFWADLAEVLRLLTATGYEEFQAQEGRYVADRLPPYINRVRRLLESSGGRPGWDAESRAGMQMILADALSTLGEQSGERRPLEEAVGYYREALTGYTRERAPLDWAMTQNNLGTALLTLGERESGTDRLEAAVLAYQEALKEQTRERVPLDWAMTQNNLGTALSRLGERESGTDRLEAAVLAYQEALKEWTRERVPLDWAMTQNNLGGALLRLGERESGTVRLEAAVLAYQEALKERTREHVPLQWAMTQHNLGGALSTLGERESGNARLEQAIQAFQEALKERTRERVPLDWALTQNNLGTALWRLGERESGTVRLEAAGTAYKNALGVFEAARASYYIPMVQGNLERAGTLLRERQAAGGAAGGK